MFDSQPNYTLHFRSINSFFFGGNKPLILSSRQGSKTNFVVAKLCTFLRRSRLGLCRCLYYKHYTKMH